MKYFPLFLRMEGETVVVAGGGEQAAQKVRLMLKTEARIVVMAPALDAELAALAREGRVARVAAVADPAALAGARVLFCATGCAGADAALAALGRAAGARVNVVDRPDLCDAITPAIVDRDPVVVATARRRGFWAWAFAGRLEALWRLGGRDAVEAAVAPVLEAGGAPDPGGAVCLVGAGPGSADLITLRGVQRLQEADVIFYDRLVDPAVLELARRDAERVFVGKAPGVPQWSQARINRLLVAAAREGRRVVRLKCGDPGVFGRAAEEIDALAEAGFDVEIVPGVTAASAAAADVGRSLTDRAGGRSLVLASGHPATDAPPVDWSALARTEATLAIYMGVARAGETARGLIAGGADPASRVDIVERAGASDSRRCETTLAALEATVRERAVRNPAVILVSPPRAAAAAAIGVRSKRRAQLRWRVSGPW